MRYGRLRVLLAGLVAGLLSACGGGGGGSAPPTYTIGGTLTGASGAVVLQNNGGDNLTVANNGAFTFATSLGQGAKYSVTVLTPPSGQTCTVGNGSGTVGTSNVTNVAVNCTNLATSNATTGSTAFSVFATPNARIAFLPVSGGVMPVSVGSVGAPAATSTRGVTPTAAYATPSVTLTLIPVNLGTSSNPISPDECSVDSGANKMVCISLQTTNADVLDLSKFANTLNSADITQQIVNLSDLPNNTTQFSGDGCVDCGLATVPNASNPSAGQFVIAGYDGYHVYSYPATGVPSITAAATYNVPISENLSVTPIVASGTVGYAWSGLIIAPGYGTGSSSSGRLLNLIDLKSGKVYTWSQPTDSCSAETDPKQQSLCSAFAAEPIDSSTVDPLTGILTLESESGNELLQIDLSQAVYSGTTFTAPHKFFDTGNANFSGGEAVTNGAEMSGVLASPTGHYLFNAAEFSTDVGVAALPSSGGSGGTFPSGYSYGPVYIDLAQTLSQAPSGSCTSFIYGSDPHRQATLLSLGGTQYGIYASGDGTCLALVNLQGLLNAPHTANPYAVDSGYNLVSNGVVTYVPVP